MKYKVGDLVRLNDKDGERIDVGKVFKISRVDGRKPYFYSLKGRTAQFCELELDLVSKGENMSKYYRVVKDHPLWSEGAILTNDDSYEKYKPVSSVWCKDLDNGKDTSTFHEVAALVEHSKEWFEQVWPLGKLEKMIFGTKKQAQAAAAALYKGSDKK